MKSPWTVSDVQLDHDQSEIRIKVDHARGTKFCWPECQSELACHDHTDERRWRHLDSCQFKTILVARIPRVKCPTHGVKNVDVPWAEKHSRFTIMFEWFSIDVLLATQTVKGAMSILGTRWDQTWNIIAQAVRRGKTRKRITLMPCLGLDEKAFKKGHSQGDCAILGNLRS
ncbi:transposase IS204/IS1001/IS1096/IS1165 family protein [Rhodopirellula sallentina SM41]|uniref:Transposase IS204/IS1001/IS1096/IS1165 family protein n=1 Tax=Rhodopirellula sallentina SM41 TaxID=1263870 RepID=M5U6K9_9BACT|nr:transposase IS204/IS1001/IS1096/IS1165 family protein [Rhodopirellula sallentina SM41]